MGAGQEAEKIVRDLTGMWWPDADEDGLRSAATAWTTLAGTIDDVCASANTSALTVIHGNSGPAIEAFTTFWSQYYYDDAGWLHDAAESCRAMATAFTQYADAVAQAKHQLEEKIAIVGGVLIAGTALAFFTGGLTELAADGAAAGIVSAAAAIGVTVSETVATIAGTVLTGAAFGAVESATVDLAVAQPIKIAFGDQKGINGTEILDAAGTGALAGGFTSGLAGGARAASTAAAASDTLSPTLAALATRLPTALGSLPGRMAVGAGVGAGQDALFGDGINPLDVLSGAIGGAAGGRARAPEKGGGPRANEYITGPDGEGGWGGAGWVEKPDPASAGQAYEAIRQTTNKVDLPNISQNTGIPEPVLRQVKAHLFRSQHDVAVGPNNVKRGLFTPRQDIADLWNGAAKGPMTEGDLNEFRALMAHEYIESELMKAGMPYTSDHPDVWDSDGAHLNVPDVQRAGAHDLSPNPTNGSWRTWDRLGLRKPEMPVAPDLSNIDIVVKSVKQELRQNGVKLK